MYHLHTCMVHILILDYKYDACIFWPPGSMLDANMYDAHIRRIHYLINRWQFLFSLSPAHSLLFQFHNRTCSIVFIQPKTTWILYTLWVRSRTLNNLHSTLKCRCPKLYSSKSQFQPWLVQKRQCSCSRSVRGVAALKTCILPSFAPCTV